MSSTPLTPAEIQKTAGHLQDAYCAGKVADVDKAVSEDIRLPIPSSTDMDHEHTEAAGKTENAPVGILGAGPGGLYAGLILDSLDIKYEILEASDRVGGRVHTHKFSEKPYDYYDLGPMRFPKTPIMDRLFDLFKYDKLKTPEGVQIYKKLIKYHFNCKDENGIQYYNGCRKRLTPNTSETPDSDFFKAKEVGVGQVYLEIGREKLYDDVINPFVTLLKKDMEDGGSAGWENLMTVDSYSARSFMTHKYRPTQPLIDKGLHKDEGLPTDVVNWMETYSMTTSWFDRAFATTVLEEMSFGYGSGEPNFFCLDGGSEVLTKAMEDCIDPEAAPVKRILKNHRVTGISMADRSAGNTSSSLLVDYVDEGATDDVEVKGIKKYGHVISTLPIPVLHHAVDLDDAELTHMQTNALRLLQYTPATKIGIKFKSAWWTKGKDADGNPIVDRDGKTIDIVGGRSFTDRPIRVVVYPSYGLEKEGSAVLIASFIWTDDAARMGALIGSGSKRVDGQLKDMVLKDLAVVHNIDLKILHDQYLEQYSVDWADNPLTMGAFALFGPGKFGSVFSSLTVPAARGKLHFAGEAISIRHGWIVGALDSVWGSIFEYLVTTNQRRKLFQLILEWDLNEEWFRGADDKQGSPPSWKGSIFLEHLKIPRGEVHELLKFVKTLKKIGDEARKELDELEKDSNGKLEVAAKGFKAIQESYEDTVKGLAKEMQGGREALKTAEMEILDELEAAMKDKDAKV